MKTNYSTPLPFIDESAIDASVAELAALDELGWERVVRMFSETQPNIFSYLHSETFSLLTQKEKEYLLYLAIIVWRACLEASEKGTLPLAKESDVGEAEETNWALLDAQSAKTFRERIDVFFQEYRQEDLLAYMEDALLDEDEEHVTKDGREYLFVAIKTVIDCLC